MRRLKRFSAPLVAGGSIALMGALLSACDTTGNALQACDGFVIEEKIRACTQLIDESGLSDQIKALAYLKRAQGYFAIGNFEESISDLGLSIRLNPKDAVAFNELGLTYKAKRNYPRAIDALNNAIDINPKLADAYYNRGIVRVMDGEYDRAINDFSAAVKENSPTATAFIENGKIIQAENLHVHVDYYKALAITYIAAGDQNRGFVTYDEAVKLFPEYAYVYQNRGDGFVAIGDFERASADIAKAISLEPNAAGVYNSRAFMRFQMGEYSASAADFTKAWSVASEDAAFPKDHLPIWIYLAEARSGKQGAEAELQRQLGASHQSGWPLPAIKLLLGQQSMADVLQAATAPEQRCEAQFYGGERYLLHGDKAAARAAFEGSLTVCLKISPEYLAAKCELGRLDQ